MTIDDRLESVQEQIAACEAACIRQGEVLVKGFRNERIAMHKHAFADRRSLRNFDKPHRPGSWCPLNLFSRYHNGSLQIYWQLVHRDRRTRSLGYKHLSKNKRGGYDLRSLLAHAKDFERELVVEYEEEAQCQRQRWQQLMKVKHYLQRLAEVNGIETSLMRRIAEQSSTWPPPNDGSDLYDPTDGIPRPPLATWSDP